MIIDCGDKVHVVYRVFFENSVRRHFIGDVTAVQGALCRIDGYVFVRDPKSEMYVKKADPRSTIFDLAESGYIVNIIDKNVNLKEVNYRYLDNKGLAAVDDQGFVLDINEFGPKS